MAEVVASGTSLGTAFTEMLMCDDLKPGDEASYQLCKQIYLFHPLGAKMAEAPIAAAQSQERIINVPGAPEDIVIKAFLEEWEKLGCEETIFRVATLSRVYGVAAVVLGTTNGKGISVGDCAKPLDMAKIAKEDIFFNVLDPLNVAGSFTNLSDPNSPVFQRFNSVTSQGVTYHPSRTVILMNEQPIYLEYEASAYGFTGRSVYQRALYPLKVFIQTMLTDELVSRKAGVIVAKVKTPGSIINNAMRSVLGFQRSIAKIAKTNDVISIDTDEEITTLDLTNVAAASEQARKHTLENIATAGDMPAKWLNNETFAEGFGEGTEDAKAIARRVDRHRLALKPIYRFMDNIVIRRAWTQEFYETIQAQFPEDYANVDYNTALYGWINRFTAVWPSLLIEPDSEKIKVEETKYKAIIGMIEALAPTLDAENLAALIDWALANINENKLLFPNPILLDMDALRDFLVEKAKAAKALAANPPGDGGDEGGDEPKPPPEGR